MEANIPKEAYFNRDNLGAPTSKWKPMEDAPKDGSYILAIRDNGLGFDAPVVVNWHPASDPKYPWSCGLDNGYPEGRLDYFQSIEIPNVHERTENGS